MPFVTAWTVWLSPWEWTSDDWAGLTFFVIFAAAFVAWRQAVEARRLREEQARPFVMIDFDPWQTIIDLRITNRGRTLAGDVQFSFDPPLTTTYDETGRGNLMDLNLFRAGIPSLAPGKEITLFFDQFASRLEKGLPMTYAVEISYSDPAGKRYSEPNVLDLSMYVGTGGVERHGLHDIHKQLKVVADSMKKWTDLEGLKILTRADIKQRHEEHLEAVREREAAREGASED